MPRRHVDKSTKIDEYVHQLVVYVQQAAEFRHTRIDLFPWSARRCAEAICLALLAEAGPPDENNEPLDQLIGRVRKSISKDTLASLETVQRFANLGSHVRSHETPNWDHYAASCAPSLAQLVDWFFAESACARPAPPNVQLAVGWLRTAPGRRPEAVDVTRVPARAPSRVPTVTLTALVTGALVAGGLGLLGNPQSCVRPESAWRGTEHASPRPADAGRLATVQHQQPSRDSGLADAATATDAVPRHGVPWIVGRLPAAQHDCRGTSVEGRSVAIDDPRPGATGRHNALLREQVQPFCIDPSIGGPSTWRQAADDCARRGGRLPSITQWESIMRAGDPFGTSGDEWAADLIEATVPGCAAPPCAMRATSQGFRQRLGDHNPGIHWLPAPTSERHAYRCAFAQAVPP